MLYTRKGGRARAREAETVKKAGQGERLSGSAVMGDGERPGRGTTPGHRHRMPQGGTLMDSVLLKGPGKLKPALLSQRETEEGRMGKANPAGTRAKGVEDRGDSEGEVAVEPKVRGGPMA